MFCFKTVVVKSQQHAENSRHSQDHNIHFLLVLRTTTVTHIVLHSTGSSHHMGNQPSRPTQPGRPSLGRWQRNEECWRWPRPPL